MATLPAVKEAGLGAWKQRVLELRPEAEVLLEAVSEFSDLIPAACEGAVLSVCILHACRLQRCTFLDGAWNVLSCM
jgi:hypothetical protein